MHTTGTLASLPCQYNCLSRICQQLECLETEIPTITTRKSAYRKDRQLLRTRDSRPVKPIVHTEGQRSAALLMVIVMLVHDPRPVPFPQSAPAHSAGRTGGTDQVERPRGMRLVCNISSNSGLSNGHR